MSTQSEVQSKPGVSSMMFWALAGVSVCWLIVLTVLVFLSMSISDNNISHVADGFADSSIVSNTQLTAIINRLTDLGFENSNGGSGTAA